MRPVGGDDVRQLSVTAPELSEASRVRRDLGRGEVPGQLVVEPFDLGQSLLHRHRDPIMRAAYGRGWSFQGRMMILDGSRYHPPPRSECQSGPVAGGEGGRDAL